MSISHWGMFEIGYFVLEVDPHNPYAGRSRYISPRDPDYCPTGFYAERW